MYLELVNVTKRFEDAVRDERDAVSEVTIGIEKGELAALLGPSGGGKTTLLRMIAGLETVTSGDILIDQQRVNDLEPSERQIGFVFQNYALFRYMTVYENIAFGLKVHKLSRREIRERVGEMLELVELIGVEKKYPNQLSGGQRQRVAFARAMVMQPSLLLLDEPFAALDARVRKELRLWLRERIRRTGITTIFVTHDQSEAVEVADKLVIVNNGRLEQSGTPYEIYKNPLTPFTTLFMGDPVILDSFSGFKGFPEIKGGSRVVVRPEYVEAFRVDNPRFRSLADMAEDGIVRDVVFRGSRFELVLEVKGIRLKCYRSLERRPVVVGEKMKVLLFRIHITDEHTTRLVLNKSLEGIDIEFL